MAGSTTSTTTLPSVHLDLPTLFIKSTSVSIPSLGTLPAFLSNGPGFSLLAPSQRKTMLRTHRPYWTFWSSTPRIKRGRTRETIWEVVWEEPLVQVLLLLRDTEHLRLRDLEREQDTQDHKLQEGPARRCRCRGTPLPDRAVPVSSDNNSFQLSRLRWQLLDRLWAMQMPTEAAAAAAMLDSNSTTTISMHPARMEVQLELLDLPVCNHRDLRLHLRLPARKAVAAG